MKRSRARTFFVVLLGGLTLALAFCSLASLVYFVVTRWLADPSPFSSYPDLLALALVFAGPCAFPSWAALVHVSLVEPRILRRPLGRGAIHGLACVVVPSVLMPILYRGWFSFHLILGLIASSALVGMLIALSYAGLAKWVGLTDAVARPARRMGQESER